MQNYGEFAKVGKRQNVLCLRSSCQNALDDSMADYPCIRLGLTFMDSVAETLRQLAFLGAVLAGFAVTFIVGLLNAPTQRRSVDYTAGTALIASACLIVCTVASVTGVFYIVDRPALHSVTDVPPEVRQAVMGTFHWAGSGFMLGITALLTSLGTSGWIRSRKLGILSSVLAALTFLLLIYFLRFVVGLI